jgi:hypothetical protein
MYATNTHTMQHNIQWLSTERSSGEANYALPAGGPFNAVAAVDSAGPRYAFIVSKASTITSVHVKGNPGSIKTLNTARDSSDAAIAVTVDLWINGTFSTTLATIPAGAATFDQMATPSISIPASAAVQFVASVPGWATGVIGNILVAIGYVNT